MTADPTIFALASAPGRAGVAVIRASGPSAFAGLRGLDGGLAAPPPRRAVIRALYDAQGMIDKALVLGFLAPASYTGEDVVEYHLHGGPAVVRRMLGALAALPGHRMAAPGEFTRRAFENGRMDLTAAEAVADLIHAETTLQQEQALRQMGGALAGLYTGWADRLARALAHVEADIDFPDEDLPDGVAAQVRPVMQVVADEITSHLDDNRRGERLRSGIQIAVIGAPNAGKSSLVNLLAQREVAIVSEHAGTTRDVIEAHLDLGGYPVILADTAGLRPGQLGDGPQDRIEEEGIRRALDRAAQADIRLLVFDAAALPALDKDTLALQDDRAIVVYNKSDIADPERLSSVAGIALSARSGAGVDLLLQVLVARMGDLFGSGSQSGGPTRTRHRDALEACRAALARSMEAPMPELMAEDLRIAVRMLGRITGRVDVEDLLDIIFKDFCIGK